MSRRRLSPLSVLTMPRAKRFIRKHFCYSWTWPMLASKELIDELFENEVTGFTGEPVVLGNDVDGHGRNFMEFKIHWRGEFASDSQRMKVGHYCESCGTIRFRALEDPPWAQHDPRSDADFFYMGPVLLPFCSAKAYEIMKRVCGDEFQAVPADLPTGRLPTALNATLTWPPISPPELCGDDGVLWKKMCELDSDGLLPSVAPKLLQERTFSCLRDGCPNEQA